MNWERRARIDGIFKYSSTFAVIAQHSSKLDRSIQVDEEEEEEEEGKSPPNKSETYNIEGTFNTM